MFEFEKEMNMEKIKNLNLTEADWLKLRDFNKQIAKRIQMRLPSDWYLTLDEIEGAVYDTFIRYLNAYEPGAMSPTSYCYQFGEMATYRDLIREYRKLKSQETFDALYGEDKDDDEPCRHIYGEAEVKPWSVDERESLQDKLEVSEMMDKMPKLDKMIAEMLMEGKSYREIAEDIGLSAMACQKRMKKYGK